MDYALLAMILFSKYIEYRFLFIICLIFSTCLFPLALVTCHTRSTSIIFDFRIMKRELRRNAIDCFNRMINHSCIQHVCSLQFTFIRCTLGPACGNSFTHMNELAYTTYARSSIHKKNTNTRLYF